MIKGFKLKKQQQWLNISFIALAVLILSLKGINNLNTLLLSIILFLIGSFREDIFVGSEGIIFKSYLLFIIPFKTVCPFNEATSISFESLDDEFTVIKYLRGNKLKRIRVRDENVTQIEKWIVNKSGNLE